MNIQSFEEFLNESSVQVNDAQFQGAHGKKPSGHGAWAFSKHKNHNPDVHSDEDMFQHTGKYAEAKKEAVKHFTTKGHIGSIYTQS